MIRGRRRFVRRLRGAVKHAVKSRDGLRWRGWGHPLIHRSATPALRLFAPFLVMGLGLAQLEGPEPARVLFCVWSLGTAIHLAAVMRRELQDRLWLTMACQLPLDAFGIHRVLTGSMRRHIRPLVWDGLCLFAAFVIAEKSWDPTGLAAACAGAVVMGLAGMAMAGVFALLPMQRVNGMWVVVLLMLPVLGFVFFHEEIPAHAWASAVDLVKYTPFHAMSDHALAAMRGDAMGWAWLAMFAAASVATLAVMRRWSARRFNPYFWDVDVAPAPAAVADAEVKPATSEVVDRVRAALAAELAKPPGTITASRGRLEKLLVSTTGEETRRCLDLLAPTGTSWGKAWIQAAVILLAGWWVCRVILTEKGNQIGFAVALCAIMVAIAPGGGSWRLLQPMAGNSFGCHLWPPLPIRVRTMNRVILFVTHFRVLLALPLLIMASRLLIDGDGVLLEDLFGGWGLQTTFGLLICTLAAAALGGVTKFAAAASALGPKGEVSYRRIIIVLAFCLCLIVLGILVFAALPGLAIPAGAVMLVGCHLTRTILTRRIDRGVYDFV